MADVVQRIRLTDGAVPIPLSSAKWVRCPICEAIGYACR